jgi:hypothetical protein
VYLNLIHYAGCYAECRNAECDIKSIILGLRMLNVIRLSVVMLSVEMLRAECLHAKPRN